MATIDYRDATRSIAEQMGYDPDLAERVFNAESGFNPRAKSPKNAYGISQMIPSTWIQVSNQTGLDNPDNPLHQIVNGIYYLREVTKQVGGDPVLGVAAYNAGPGAVKKYGGVPPYAETQGYVSKIFGKLGLGPREAQAAQTTTGPRMDLGPTIRAAQQLPVQKPKTEDIDWAAELIRGSEPKGVQNGMQQGEEGEEGQGKQIDWAAELYKGPTATTIQGPQPGQKDYRQHPGQRVGTQGLSFNTLQKSKWVDNPKTKAEIFAREQFPNEPLENAVKRYFQRGGNWYFIDNDGMAYPVEGQSVAPEANQGTGVLSNLASGVRDIAAETVGKSPVIVGSALGGAAGMMTGHPLAGSNVGAAGGHIVRKMVGNTLLDEPVEKPGQFLGGMGQEVINNTLGYGLGKAVPAIANKALASGKGVVGPALTGELERINPTVVAQRVQAYREAGVTPTLAEIFDSPTLANILAMGQKTAGPAAENIRTWAKETRIPQLQEAIETALTGISPETSVLRAGAGAATAAQSAKERLVDARNSLAKPYYDAAKESTVPIDVTDIIKGIDDELAPNKLPQGSTSRETLEWVKRMLTRVSPADRGSGIPTAEARAMVNEQYAAIDEIRKIGIDPRYFYSEYGDEWGGKIIQELQQKLPGIIKKNGTGIDLLAERYGFGSIDDLYYAIKDYTNKPLLVEKLQAGNVPSKAKTIEAQDQIYTLDYVKKEIDKRISGLQGQGIPRDTKRRLVEIKDALTTKMDDAVPDYNVARAVYAEASLPINEFETGVMVHDPTRLGKYSKTFLDQVEKTTGFDVETLPGKMFSKSMSPEDIAHARKFIEAENPDAWSAFVAGGLRDKFNALKETAAGTDLGYRFKKAVFATNDDKARLQAATTPEQFARLKTLFEVFDQTERVVYNNSQTAMMEETNRIIRNQPGGPLARFMANYGTISPQKIARSWQAMATPEYMEKVTNAILTADPATIQALSTIRRIPYGAQRAIATGAMISTIVGGGMAEDSMMSSEWYPEGGAVDRDRARELLKKQKQ